MSLILIRRGLFAVLLALCVAVAVSAAPRIENSVTIADPKSPVLRVTTVITGLESQPQLEVGIPGWAPGYHIIEDFARNISRLVFTDQTGRRLRHEKNHDSIWLVDTRGASSLKIEFEYAANELDLNKVKTGDIFLSIGPFSADDPKWPEEYRRAYAGREGETVEMKVLRDGKPVRLAVKIKLREDSSWNLRRLPESAPAQKELLDRWISGK